MMKKNANFAKKQPDGNRHTILPNGKNNGK